MRKQAAIRAEADLSSYGGQIPLFDQIAYGFLDELSSHRQSLHATACLDYLDGKIKADGDWYTRRTMILAVEDLKQQIEAPQLLCREVYDFMKLLGLTPIPELKLYRDVATAILRIDATLHLSRISGARRASGFGPVYH
jgi:hypothetical protein